ncbi:MAG: hypothetical protein ACJAS4_002999 [Bacteriovoracaceae bacterium]|jgi:hypothetical protein
MLEKHMPYCNQSLALIHKIKTELYCDDDFIRKVLELSKPDYSKAIKSNNLSFKNICNFTNFFNIDIQDLVDDRVDWDKARTSILTSNSRIPDQYKVAAGSYIRQIRSIFTFVQNKTNKKTADLLLNKLGISSNNLLDDSSLINLKLVNDALELVFKELNFNQDDLRVISIHALLNNKGITGVLKDSNGDAESICRLIAKNSNHYEKNFSYSFKNLGNGISKVSSKSRADKNETFQSAQISSPITSQLKAMIIDQTSLLIGPKKYTVIDIKDHSSKGSQQTDYFIKNI